MNKQKGKLNGLTSTGKTSICKELISRKKYSFFEDSYPGFIGTLIECIADIYV
ncbi:MAG: hypothetical protein ACOX1Q_10875 [Eubacteriales bacterium]